MDDETQQMFKAAKDGLHEITQGQNNVQFRNVSFLTAEKINSVIAKVMLELELNKGNRWEKKRVTVQIEKRPKIFSGLKWDYSHQIWMN